MTAPRLRGAPAAQQAAGRLLGKYDPAAGVHLTLHDKGGEALLLRHRKNAHAGSAATIAAHITYAGGVVSAVDWDAHHRKHKPTWMKSVEDWITGLIAEAWAES